MAAFRPRRQIRSDVVLSWSLNIANIWLLIGFYRSRRIRMDIFKTAKFNFPQGTRKSLANGRIGEPIDFLIRDHNLV
jgi:hypothetical protein